MRFDPFIRAFMTLFETYNESLIAKKTLLYNALHIPLLFMQLLYLSLLFSRSCINFKWIWIAVVRCDLWVFREELSLRVFWSNWITLRDVIDPVGDLIFGILMGDRCFFLNLLLLFLDLPFYCIFYCTYSLVNEAKKCAKPTDLFNMLPFLPNLVGRFRACPRWFVVSFRVCFWFPDPLRDKTCPRRKKRSNKVKIENKEYFCIFVVQMHLFLYGSFFHKTHPFRVKCLWKKGHPKPKSANNKKIAIFIIGCGFVNKNKHFLVLQLFSSDPYFQSF